MEGNESQFEFLGTKKCPGEKPETAEVQDVQKAVEGEVESALDEDELYCPPYLIDMVSFAMFDDENIEAMEEFCSSVGFDTKTFRAWIEKSGKRAAYEKHLLYIIFYAYTLLADEEGLPWKEYQRMFLKLPFAQVGGIPGKYAHQLAGLVKQNYRG